MRHIDMWREFTMHAKVSVNDVGHIHSVKRGRRIVYWVSEYKFGGNVVHTGMFDFKRRGALKEKPFKTVPEALRFLGILKPVAKGRENDPG